MKRVILILMLAGFFNLSHAQDDADTLWRVSGLTSLNFSQLSLTNWNAGGENSVAVNALVNLNANYQNRDGMLNWDNSLIMGYGSLTQKGLGTRKSDDKIDLASKFGYKAGEKWFYSGLLSFKTQFADGLDYADIDNPVRLSSFLAPAYLNLSIGMDFKPNENFSMLIAPVTGKMTMVMDDALSTQGVFGVPAGENVRSEFGGYIKIAYGNEIFKNVALLTKLDLFSNYIENPQYVDVNFDLILSFKINKFLSASFMSQLIYDYDIKYDDGAGGEESRIQFKELFGIGLSYSFKNFE